LGWRYARRAKQRNGEGCESEGFELEHDLSLIRWSGEEAGELSLRGGLEAGEPSGIHHSTEGSAGGKGELKSSFQLLATSY
jgi:hypothetical protein